MLNDYLQVGDTVADSPVGPGTITGITEAGYPQVNYVAVGFLTRTDGTVFDPHGMCAQYKGEATQCGQVSDGIACITMRTGIQKLCPDCNPWRPE